MGPNAATMKGKSSSTPCATHRAWTMLAGSHSVSLDPGTPLPQPAMASKNQNTTMARQRGRIRGQSRFPYRRAALIDELTLAFSLGVREPPAGALVRRVDIVPGLTPPERYIRSRRLTDDEEYQLGQWTMPSRLISVALPGFMRFRKALEDVGEAHADTCVTLVGAGARTEASGGDGADAGHCA